jgi:hypothetical protein
VDGRGRGSLRSTLRLLVAAPSSRASPRTRLFFRVRVAVLLAILAGVVLWGSLDVRSRHERNRWNRSLSIAIVLVRRGPVEDAAVTAFRSRIPALEARLADECHLYRPDSLHPFRLTFIGPADANLGPPDSDGDGWIAAAKQSWERWRWTSRVNRAAGFDPKPYDSCIYVVARPPASDEHEMVEGESEEGGRVGTVEVELDASMADFSLFVVAHELLHTLGASDKYDDAGRTLIPRGLAEPDRVPRFPQRFAEVMARNVPLSPTDERPPETLEQLAVGPVTAAEIGWIEGAAPPGDGP